jgi:hypothetical protein
MLPPLCVDGTQEVRFVSSRLFGLSGAMRRLSDLLDNEDDPLATLLRMVGDDVEECASWLDEYSLIQQKCIDDADPPEEAEPHAG